jgi:hypothetical protein
MAKKALCIGINDYPGVGSDLSGCVNDANDWKAALEVRDFTVALLLNDQATRKAMYNGIQSLVREGRAGDMLVITYSGHGSWIPDLDDDEPDGRDEVLCPYDISQNGPLIDDELYDIFAERERGVRIVFISDSCNSGTVIKFAPSFNGASAPRVRSLPPANFLPSKLLPAAAARAAHRSYGAARPFGGVLISGCQDDEYSYDATFDGRPNGAFTYFALKALKSLPAGASYRDWFKAIRELLPNQNYPQKPNIGGSRSQKAWRVFA